MVARRAPEHEGVREAVLGHGDGLWAVWENEAGWLLSFHNAQEYPRCFVRLCSLVESDKDPCSRGIVGVTLGVTL